MGFIFRDYGDYIGFDFAFVDNGYVYHTRLDTLDRIPLDSISN